MPRNVNANLSGGLSQIDVGRKRDTPAASVPFVIEQRLKEVYTAMPGVVKKYNPKTSPCNSAWCV